MKKIFCVSIIASELLLVDVDGHAKTTSPSQSLKFRRDIVRTDERGYTEMVSSEGTYGYIFFTAVPHITLTGHSAPSRTVEAGTQISLTCGWTAQQPRTVYSASRIHGQHWKCLRTIGAVLLQRVVEQYAFILARFSAQLPHTYCTMRVGGLLIATIIQLQSSLFALRITATMRSSVTLTNLAYGCRNLPIVPMRRCRSFLLGVPMEPTPMFSERRGLGKCRQTNLAIPRLLLLMHRRPMHLSR